MNGWFTVAAVAGCGVGAAIRFSLGWLDLRRTFPWPTVLANVLGSALLGAVLAASDATRLSTGWAFVLGVGVAGGLSTFSSLAVDVVVLTRARRRWAAAGYVTATAALGLAAASAGYGVVASLG